MISFRNVKFIKSAPSIDEAPEEKLDEIIIIGKSNVGKSSLINALTNQKSLAYTSSKPGHTTLLNYFLVDEKFYLVDAPGYGYSARDKHHFEKFGEMMEGYFADSKRIKGVMFLTDSRHKPSKDDLDFYEYVKGLNIPFVIIFTKSDKLNQKEKSECKKNAATYYVGNEYILYSIYDEKSLEEIKKEIAGLVKI